ncbi:fatty acid conjugase FAC2 A-like [Rutidosis leptorrhynchoides]|uniref:fatty acid conjugase FAC2 A-like n=1 Tax=Rutidosis leptorrhynchoides TaxID=125765 RepID=UPI003A9A2BA1
MYKNILFRTSKLHKQNSKTTTMEETNHMKSLKRVHISKPPFEYSDLKKAVPPHCFKHSLFRSFKSLFRDIFIMCTLFYISINYIPLLPKPISYVVWPIYWSFQAVIFGGIWGIGHECCLRGFTGRQWLDDPIGFLILTCLLTPYYSMKFSHRTHHAHTNSIEYDEIHVPKLNDDKLYSKVLNNRIGVILQILFNLTFGWSAYLFFNYTGRKYEGIASHFYPNSRIFNDSERGLIFLSDIGIFVALYGYYRIAMAKGVFWAINVFGLPLFLMCSLLMFLTYLQHTHPSIAHYDSTEWNWMRGALSTIDRDVGFLNYFVHDLPRIHVLHHLFPTIPHYHAIEALEAVKPILGEYYNYDDTFILKAFWREMKECIYVESDDGEKKGGVYWYKNKIK